MAQCSISKNKLATDNIYIYIIFNCHSLTLFYLLPIYQYNIYI